MPLSSVVIQTPDDGLPSIEDWVTVTISFIFSGSRLRREPVDLNFDKNQNVESPVLPCFNIKKGFTRMQLGYKYRAATTQHFSNLVLQAEDQWPIPFASGI